MPTTFLKNPVSVNVPSTAEGLNVSGIPAAPTSGGGVQPSNTLTVQGTAGQDTTGTGQAAGAGAGVSITAGAGGAAPSGSTNGAGGSVIINPGPPGIGVGAAATYGNIVMATTGGNIGIGTTSPAYLLHLKPSAGVGLYLETTATADAFGSMGSDPVSGPAFNYGYAGASFGRGAGFMNVGPDASATGINPALYFGTNNTVRQVIDRNGNVGIGTTGPTGKLAVVGSATAGAVNIDLGNSAALTTSNEVRLRLPTYAAAVSSPAAAPYISALNMSGASGASDLAFGTVQGSAATQEVLRMTNTGNVGIGTTTPGSKLHVIGGVQIGTPTGGDKGPGSINVSGDIYKNGSPHTSRDCVFEHHFTGSTPADYQGPVPLEQLEDAIRASGQLPGVGREPMGIFDRQDVLLEKLEEAYLYIIELTKRVDRLETTLASAKEQRS